MDPSSSKYPRRQAGGWSNSTERVRRFRARQSELRRRQFFCDSSPSEIVCPLDGSGVDCLDTDDTHTIEADTLGVNFECLTEMQSEGEEGEYLLTENEHRTDDNEHQTDDDNESVSLVQSDDLVEKLQHWAIDNHCTRSTVNGILNILHEQGFNHLPIDKRTLLDTMRSVDVVSTPIGDYINFGIRRCIEKVKLQSSDIILQFGIDGIPLFKNKWNLWPITVMINGVGPYVVSLWYVHGSKPSDIPLFLEEFIEELKTLTRNGMDIDGKHYDVRLHSIISDAPARSSLKCIAGHNGYNSCERCTINGSYKSHRVVFSKREFDVEKRDDETFRTNGYVHDEHPHQLGVSPLCSLPSLDMVYLFPLDYMHLTCLGVTRRLLHYFRGDYRGINDGKLSSSLQETLNKGPSGLRNVCLPSEFNRKSRGIDELDHWKATELRTFMVYTGLVALKPVLTSSQYKHFLSYSIAMRILLEESDEFRLRLLDDAHSLLSYFVWNAREHYGDLFVVYNVHGLLHLVEDSRFYHCSLDKISAFPFENFLGHLKKLVRGKFNPLSQLAKRTDEWCRYKVNGCIKKVIQKVDTKNNSWFLTTDGYVHVKSILKETVIVDLYPHRLTQDLFTHFIPSREMGIVVLKQSLKPVVNRINFTNLLRKCVCLTYKDSWVLIKLLNDFTIC